MCPEWRRERQGHAKVRRRRAPVSFYNSLIHFILMAPELSIVIPVRNESPNIKPLYDELTQTLGQYGRSYELLIVDDGSTDDTFEQLSALQARDPRLRVI